MKSALFLLTAVIAAVTLTGCGGGGNDTTSTTTTTVAPRTVTLETTSEVAGFAPIGGFMFDAGETEAGCTSKAIAAFSADGVLRVTRIAGPNADAAAGNVPPASTGDPSSKCGIAPVWYRLGGDGVKVLTTPAPGRDPRQSCLASSNIDLLYTWPQSGINVQVCEGNANAMDAAVTDVLAAITR